MRTTPYRYRPQRAAWTRLSWCLITLSVAVSAQPRLAGIFGDHMVVQRDRTVAIWGWDIPGRSVQVSVAGQSVSAIAGPDSAWRVALAPMAAGGPYELTAVGSRTWRCSDVLVGEVWLASGQSNMEFRLDRTDGADEAIAASADQQYRLCTVPRALSEMPQKDGEASWIVAGEKATGRFSAAAYWFGRTLRDSLQVPVGVIHSSWGGTAAESWVPWTVLESDTTFRSIIDRWEESVRTFPEKQAEYLRRKPELDAKWLQDSAAAVADHRAPPAKPSLPRGPGSRDTPSGQWNAMIHPWLQTALRGIIWYQGESNATRSTQYRRLFPALIRSWRLAWNDETLPFYFVQLPNLRRAQDLRREGWPDLRDVQRATLAVPYTGMAVTIDVGDPMDLHPRVKRPVGERLALLALSKTYDRRDIVSSGPLYAGHRVEDDRVIITFTELGGGLRGRVGPELTGFLIAADDKIFRPAQARIEGDAVVVWRSGLPRPVAVRYAWAEDPDWSLMNAARLPASPFRTDAWREVTFGLP